MYRPNAETSMSATHPSNMTTKRTGWVIRGVSAPESIADHMYRMGMMSLVASGSELDQARCVKMSIVHDVAEAIVGDITPHCKVSPEEKKRLEADAVAQIQSMLGLDTRAAQEVSELWREYEAAASPEAQFVKDMDKIEMILQAYEYEGLQQGLNLQEFYDGTAGRFKTEAGKALAAEVLARRQVRRASAVEGPGPAAAPELMLRRAGEGSARAHSVHHCLAAPAPWRLTCWLDVC
ncbi:HD domain-containing protein [Haematococcus lacustris]|uniref:5'-deoxynucleotidase n=1 Tax=Haematococcus lacustris TaxID=44745 RepID=A0A6A0AGJ0_HAELA|nr:HD domain-containing protein [Haematococcus lacustris]